MLLFMCTCVRGEGRYVLVSEGVGGGQKKASDPPEIKLQAIVDCPVWVLETKFGSSKRSK